MRNLFPPLFLRVRTGECAAAGNAQGVDCAGLHATPPVNIRSGTAARLSAVDYPAVIGARRRSARQPYPTPRYSTRPPGNPAACSDTSGSTRAPRRPRQGSASCLRRSASPGWRCSITLSVPLPSTTSQAQPLPKRPVAGGVHLRLQLIEGAERLGDRARPVRLLGAPPAFGPMISQNIE